MHFVGNEWTIGLGSFGGFDINKKPFYYSAYNKQSNTSNLVLSLALPDLNGLAEYQISLNISANLYKKGTLSIFLQYTSGESLKEELVIFDQESGNIKNKIVKTSFKMPSGVTNCTLAVAFSGAGEYTKSDKFYFTDINVEGFNISEDVKQGFDDVNKNLQNGFDALGQALNPNVPYEPIDQSGLNDLKNQISQGAAELPQVDMGMLDSILNSAPIEEFRPAFLKINSMFEKIINVSGLAPLLGFTLVFGLCMFLIGRI